MGLRKFGSFTVGFIATAWMTTQNALAATTYFTQLQTGVTIVQSFVSVACYLGAIVLLGMCAWEYMQHRRIGAMVTEVIGAIFAVVVAANGSTIATALGLTAASLH